MILIIKENLMQLRIDTKNIAYISMLVTIALICSYVESIIPINFGIPGIKIGLANIVSVVAIYIFPLFYAILIVILRVIISGFLFGSLYSILYSMAGGLLSILVMILLKRSSRFSVTGISIAGGVTHNIGQLIVAILVVNQMKISYYGPALIVAGVIMGMLIGIVSGPIIKRVETYVR